MPDELIRQQFTDLRAALTLLQASLARFVPYQTDRTYTPDELEYYDALSFRFEKTIELMLIFMRGLEGHLSASVSDTIRDRLLLMQKLKLIDEVEFWIEARLLRNKIAHAYLPTELHDLYAEINRRAPTIVETADRIARLLAAPNR